MAIKTTISSILITLGLATPTLADWVTTHNTRNNSVRTTASADGKSLKLSCLPREPAVSLVLNEGANPKVSTNGESSIMMWIKQPDGRTSRHPIDGQFLDWETSFVGRFVTNSFVLDQFASGAELELTNSRGNVLFRTDMKGTSAARQDFRRYCGK